MFWIKTKTMKFQNLLKERRRISPEVEDIDITMGTRQDEEITLVLHDINQLNQNYPL